MNKFILIVCYGLLSYFLGLWVNRGCNPKKIKLIKWSGGKCPVDKNNRVMIRWKDCTFGVRRAGGINWSYVTDYAVIEE